MGLETLLSDTLRAAFDKWLRESDRPDQWVWITADQACALLDVSAPTLSRNFAAARSVAGGRVYYSRKKLDEILASRLGANQADEEEAINPNAHQRAIEVLQHGRRKAG